MKEIHCEELAVMIVEASKCRTCGLETQES